MSSWINGTLDVLGMKTTSQVVSPEVPKHNPAAKHRFSDPTRLRDLPNSIEYEEGEEKSNKVPLQPSKKYSVSDDSTVELDAVGCGENICSSRQNTRKQKVRNAMSLRIRELELQNTQLKSNITELEQHTDENVQIQVVQALQEKIGMLEKANHKLSGELTTMKGTAEIHKLTNHSLSRKLEELDQEDESHNIEEQLQRQVRELQETIKLQNTKVAQLELSCREKDEENQALIQASSGSAENIDLLNSRDDTIAELRKKCMDYSKELTERTENDSKQNLIHTALKEELEKTQARLSEFESKVKVYKARDRATTQHVDELNDSVQKLEHMFEENEAARLSQISKLEEKVGYFESNSARLPELERELTEARERLDQSLEENENSILCISREKEAEVEELRRRLNEFMESERNLREQLALANESHEQTLREHQQKISERDAMIAGIVKSSSEKESNAEHERSQLESSFQESLLGETSRIKQLEKQLAASQSANAELCRDLESANLALEQSKADFKVASRKSRMLHSISTEQTASDDESLTTSNTQRIIKERDDVIAKLVKTSKTQESTIADLQKKLKDLDVQQLQKEAEVFAGQVIELDEEIEQLRSILSEKERQATELSTELMNIKSRDTNTERAIKIRDLEAEIDELKEANSTQVEELRDLRRKTWEGQATQDELAALRNQLRKANSDIEEKKRQCDELSLAKKGVVEQLRVVMDEQELAENTLRAELEAVRVNLTERANVLEELLRKSEASYAELKSSPSHMDPEEVVALQDKLMSQTQTVAEHRADLEDAKRTIFELEGMLAERNAEEAAAYEDEKEELLAEVESLSQQLDDAREKLHALAADEAIIDDFKEKLENADKAREESEKTIIETYERKLSLLALDKDVTIDKLRTELVTEKTANEEEMNEVTSELKKYQAAITDLKEEMEDEIGDRDSRIFALQHTLEAQEQLVGNMKSEMDHLQGSMESSAAHRKVEIEEMQQELLAANTTTSQQERDIQALKVELESKVHSYEEEITELREKIVHLEKIPEEHRNAQDLQMELRVKEVKDRLEKLKWRNTSLKEENINLKERLEHAEAVAQTNQYPERLKALEEELSSQVARTKELEAQLQSAKEPPALPTRPAAKARTQGRGRSVPKPSKSTVTTVPSASSPRRLGIFSRKTSAK